MIGSLVMRTPHGYAYGSSHRVEFGRADVAALGKLRRYNDAVVRYMVRLRDDRVLFVSPSKEQKADRAWLTKLGERLGSPGDTTRDTAQAEKWMEVA